MNNKSHIINHTGTVKRRAALARLGFKLFAANAALRGNDNGTAQAKAGARALGRAFTALNQKFRYLDQTSVEPPEVARLGAYIDPYNSAEGAAKLAAIIALGDRLDLAQRAQERAVARGTPYRCLHSSWEIEKRAPECPCCAVLTAQKAFGTALRALDPYFYLQLDNHGFPENPRNQIAAAAVQLAEAWSYYLAFAFGSDARQRPGTVAAVGVEIATRKLQALQEDWRRRSERAQERHPNRIRRRPLYRMIKGERVRVYRPDEIEPVEPLEDNV